MSAAITKRISDSAPSYFDLQVERLSGYEALQRTWADFPGLNPEYVASLSLRAGMLRKRVGQLAR